LITIVIFHREKSSVSYQFKIYEKTVLKYETFNTNKNQNVRLDPWNTNTRNHRQLIPESDISLTIDKIHVIDSTLI